jgi:hypothetical protein
LASSLTSYQNDELGKNSNYPEDTVSNECEAVSEVQKVPNKNLPAVSVPDIIILIDLSENPNYTPFKLGDVTNYASLCMIQSGRNFY